MNELVHIIITTYDPGDNSRFNLLRKTVVSLKNNLQYPNLKWVIADDGSQNFPQDELSELLEGQPTVFFNAERCGVGKSKNLALNYSFDSSPYVLLLEDDWALKQPFDLFPYIKTLEENKDVGMIRFGFLGGPMTAQFTELSGVTYWKLLHKTGFYVYSGQVSLRHKRFYDKLGYHVEHEKAGKEEEEFCHRYNDAHDVPCILWDAQFGCTINAGPFVNIGLDNSVNDVEII